MNYLPPLKTLIPSLVLIAFAHKAFTQSTQTEVEIFQEAIGLEKKEAIGNSMELGEDAQNFWKIYDEYEAKRKKLGLERIKVIADYAMSYPNISDEEIETLFKRTNAFKKSFAKLQTTNFKRMKKEVGASKAAQFWQLETYFNSIIQAEIYSQIPFIGENLKGN